MALFVENCSRCGAKEITFDVMGAIPAGKGIADWVKRFEVFVSCRRCRRSSTFLLEIYRYDDQNKFDDPSAFRENNNLNASFRSLGILSLKDQEVAAPPEHVPEGIKAIFREGATCLSVHCWNASSTMFRLCVDLATQPLLPEEDAAGPQPNARQRRDLGLRVPWLIENGRLPAELAGLAAAVREDGNDGAHAGNLEQADAEDLMDFTVLLLDRLFAEPGRLLAAAERRARRRAAP